MKNPYWEPFESWGDDDLTAQLAAEFDRYMKEKERAASQKPAVSAEWYEVQYLFNKELDEWQELCALDDQGDEVSVKYASLPEAREYLAKVKASDRESYEYRIV